MAFGKVAKSLVWLSSAAVVAGIAWPRLADTVYPGGAARMASLRSHLPSSLEKMLPAYNDPAKTAEAQKTPAGGPAGGPPGRGRGGPRGGGAPVTVIVGQATKGPLPYVIGAVGTVQPIATVALRTRVDSYIDKILVPDGASVEAGQTLVLLDSRQIEAQIKQAEAQLQRDQSTLEQAERDVRRYTELFAKNAGTKINLDNAKTQVANARALIASDQAQLENLKVQLTYYTIKTPVAGRVGTFLAKAGNIIRSGDNSTTGALATVAQMAPIYVNFSLAQHYLPEIRKSIEEGTGYVEATPQGASRSAKGRIAILDNAIDSATGTISIRAVFENKDEFLWPGQLCNLRIVLRTDDNVVTIPRDATQSGQTGSYVFAIKDGVASVKPIKISRSQDGRDVIASGLEGNETVVTDGALALVNGSRVQVRNEAAKRGS